MKKLFNTLAVFSTAIFAAGCFSTRNIPDAPDGQPLTPGEKQNLRALFGYTIRPDSYFKYYRADGDSMQPDSITAGTIYKRGVYFFGDSMRYNDLSRAPLKQFAVFMHEFAHQFSVYEDVMRTKPSRAAKMNDTVYNYVLTPKSSFYDFGEEQRAAMIEDYARLYLWHGGRGEKRWGVKTPEQDALLTALIERKFPVARRSRLQMEKTRQKQTPAP